MELHAWDNKTLELISKFIVDLNFNVVNILIQLLISLLSMN